MPRGPEEVPYYHREKPKKEHKPPRRMTSQMIGIKPHDEFVEELKQEMIRRAKESGTLSRVIEKEVARNLTVYIKMIDEPLQGRNLAEVLESADRHSERLGKLRELIAQGIGANLVREFDIKRIAHKIATELHLKDKAMKLAHDSHVDSIASFVESVIGLFLDHAERYLEGSMIFVEENQGVGQAKAQANKSQLMLLGEKPVTTVLGKGESIPLFDYKKDFLSRIQVELTRIYGGKKYSVRRIERPSRQDREETMPFKPSEAKANVLVRTLDTFQKLLKEFEKPVVRDAITNLLTQYFHAVDTDKFDDLRALKKKLELFGVGDESVNLFATTFLPELYAIRTFAQNQTNYKKIFIAESEKTGPKSDVYYNYYYEWARWLGEKNFDRFLEDLRDVFRRYFWSIKKGEPLREDWKEAMDVYLIKPERFIETAKQIGLLTEEEIERAKKLGLL